MDLSTHEGAVPFNINIFNAGKAANEYRIQHLVQYGKFNVPNRILIEDKIRASNLNTTGIIDPDTAKKIGELLGADYSVYGNVNDVTLSETGTNTGGVGLEISTVTVKSHITKVTQDSVHNALQKAAFQTVDILIKRLYDIGK
ncbi:MAG: hypothetical protein SR1Q7_02775 [Quinella sp. 1Q7]|nr:hypothetical protein [Quinella sp. 1Q7]